MGIFFNKKNKKIMKKSRDKEVLSGRLDIDLNRLKEEFSYPTNEDFIIRKLVLKGINKKCVLVFLGVMVNEDMIQQHIIEPILESKQKEEKNIIQKVITAKEGKEVTCFDSVINNITMGNTILLMDGYSKAISIETTKFDHRNVEKPISENIIKGPQEAFVESGKTNKSLIRKQLRSKNLVTESITVGEQSKSKISILYMKNIANPRLVKQIKERIEDLEVDTVQNIPMLEQYIEERPYSIIPSILYTERPDRAVSFLHEGHVVLLMDSSSDCLILPVTFWSLFHTSGDSYLRWSNGNFVRVVRLIAFFAALLTPALFVAITTFHVEMIPTDLALAITATRERVPFPLLIEVILMEMAFELLRESGLRIPTPIGPTIGIVGALILGQAAVQANLVSPILVIIVSITGLSSFAIANLSLNYTMRIVKFGLLILGGLMGIAGVTAGLMAFIAYMVSVKSFDVPFISPLTPHYRSSKDVIFRPPIWKQWIRPQYTAPKDSVRKKAQRRE